MQDLLRIEYGRMRVSFSVIAPADGNAFLDVVASYAPALHRIGPRELVRAKKKTDARQPKQPVPADYSATTGPDEVPLGGTGVRSVSGT